MSSKLVYTCNEYREEMILLGLRRRLSNDELTDNQRKELIAEIKEIEQKMDME